MSTYPFWLLSFDLRDDVEQHVLRVLTACGRGEQPDPGDLDRLPPGLRSYLGSGEMQSDQGKAVAGTPVRLARSSGAGLTLTIEFCQHDDEFNNGGWLLWLWVRSLARRPDPRDGRSVLGYSGLYRGDAESRLVYIDAQGVTEDGRLTRFSEIDAALGDEWVEPQPSDT